MSHYHNEDNTPRILGFVAVAIYLVGVVCALIFVHFRTSLPVPRDVEGIEINFGVSSAATGTEDLASTDMPHPQSDPTPELPAEEVIEEVEERPREVNQRALFPGRTPDSHSVSEGESTREEELGNAGDVSGKPDGVEYTLTGRTIVGELPKPDYSENMAGKVIIDIVVNESGRVTAATYRAQGSTTNSSVLIDAARAAALKARFSEDESFVQGGSITYIFKME